MSDIPDGGEVQVQGSGSKPWVLRNVGGVYSCNCPAWRNQSVPIERRTCKHLKQVRGAQVEEARVGLATAPAPKPSTASTVPGAPPVQGAKPDAPPLLLAHSWERDVDLSGWWMSEKLDGVRAYWTGTRFLSRLGNEYFAPPWFTAGLPNTPLDGEIFAGRKLFQKTVSIVRRQDQSPAWKELSFVVFDAPGHPGLFEERLQVAEQLIAAAKNPQVRFHEHQRCLSNDHLLKELARVEALGAEGLMMRRPGSKYEVGRSSTLLKVKTFKDAEARVLAQVAGAGKFAGMMGALEVELPDGTRFSVGTGFSDDERRTGYPPGTLITFRYQELSKDGVPRFPSFVGVRIDGEFTPKARVAQASLPMAPPAPPAPVVAAPVPPVAAKGDRRRFERPMSTGEGTQFWQIELAGAEYRVAFGVVGGPAHHRTTRCANAWAAAKDAMDRVSEKLSKGYAEV
jgi:DNA ligase-1